MLPEVAITGFDGHSGTVWTLRGGRLEPAELRFGARDDRGRVEVTGGLAEAAQIVTSAVKPGSEGRLARQGTTP